LLLLVSFGTFASAEPDRFPAGVRTREASRGDNIHGILGSQSWNPAVAYDPETNRYLVVYEHVTEVFDYQIFGRIVTPDGTALGNPFLISDAGTTQRYPCISRGTDGKFLVVWRDDRSTYTEIYGRFINPNGTPEGNELLLSAGNGNKHRPWVAHSSARGRFLVVWEDTRNGSSDIYGQMVNEGGSLYDINFALADNDASQMDPAVAYDSGNDRFLVVWTDDRNFADSGLDIYAQFVNADWGDPIDRVNALYLTGSDVNIPVSSATGDQYRASVAFDGTTYDRFMVVWVDDRNDITHDLYCQFVAVEGGELIYDPPDFSQNIPISLAGGNQSDPFVAKDDCNGEFWVAWADDRNSGQEDIYGQVLKDDGALYGTDFAISRVAIGERAPLIAVNGNCGALVAFESHQPTGSVIGFAAITGQARISVSPSPVNFGQVLIGNPGEETLTLSNNGHADLTLTAVQVLGPDAGAFEVVGGESAPCSDFPMVLTQGASCTLLAVFVPVSEGEKTAALRVSSDDPETPAIDVPLIGNGFVYTEVTVLTPNGGELFAAGEDVLIEWGAPATAVKFELFYSVDDGLTWKAITKDFVFGMTYGWIVPPSRGNKRSCLLKVVGYNSKGVPVGSDRSDGVFTIEVVKLAYPDGGETFYSGGMKTLTWTVNTTKKPVTSIKLYYTKNKGTTWTLITALAGDETYYEWSPLPAVTTRKTKCKVKVVLKDANGVTLGIDRTDGYFTLTNDR
jgi:hypothetical protein